MARCEARKKTKDTEFTIDLKINRDQIWEDTISQLTKKTGPQITNSRTEIKFKHESGIDAGGLSREWINLALKSVFDP